MRWSVLLFALIGQFLLLGRSGSGQQRSCSPGNSQTIDLDGYKDQTPPPKVWASHTAADHAYAFRHLSDVDADPAATDPKWPMFIYTHIVKNDSQGPMLPFIWHAAGIGLKQTLPSGNSYSNCFSLPFDFRVEPTATIDIGMRLNNKVQAPTYVWQPPANPQPANAEALPLGGTPVRSRLAIGEANNDRPSIDVGVTCFVVEGTELHIEFVNAGVGLVHFKMPEMTSALQTLQRTERLEIRKNWEGSATEGYRLPPTPPDGPQAFVASVRDGRFRVKPTRLELFDADRNALGHGRVTVYLPEVPR